MYNDRMMMKNVRMTYFEHGSEGLQVKNNLFTILLHEAIFGVSGFPHTLCGT